MSKLLKVVAGLTVVGVMLILIRPAPKVLSEKQQSSPLPEAAGPEQAQTGVSFAREITAKVAKDDAVGQLIAEMCGLAGLTDTPAAEKLQMKLKERITDANAGAIVRGVPPTLLETPFGLMALEKWSVVDRKAAVEWLANQGAPTQFQVATALRGWVEKDNEAVHAYLNGLPSSPWKEKALAAISQDALMNADPLEAITELREMRPGETQTRLAKDACLLWAQGDPESTAAWVDKVNDPALKSQLISVAAIGTAYSDPEGAIKWALKALPPGEELNNTMGYVVRVWAEESSPYHAALWVSQQPAGSMRQSALKELISQWQQSDSRGFYTWVNGLPSGSLRQDVTIQLARVNSTGSL